MSKFEKDLKRLLSKPKDFTYDEAKAILNKVGFVENNKGKTSGSRVMFEKENVRLELHIPHPKRILKEYQIIKIIEVLKKVKVI